jgi:hypothetical protein
LKLGIAGSRRVCTQAVEVKHPVTRLAPELIRTGGGVARRRPPTVRITGADGQGKCATLGRGMGRSAAPRRVRRTGAVAGRSRLSHDTTTAGGKCKPRWSLPGYPGQSSRATHASAVAGVGDLQLGRSVDEHAHALETLVSDDGAKPLSSPLLFIFSI